MRSALVLPELLDSTETDDDVVIRIGKLSMPGEGHAIEGSYCHVVTGHAYFFWEAVGAFLVENGREITVDPAPEVEPALLRLPLLGTVIAALLQQRGLTVLHASAVALNGGAVAFVGAKGMGKSTIAATLYSMGHASLADDVVALDLGGNRGPMVQPAFPSLKLSPEAAAKLSEDTDPAPGLSSLVGKSYRRTPFGFPLDTVPLTAICVLGSGPSPRIVPLTSQAGMIELIRHSHLARFGEGMFRDYQESHFLQCADIARQVPVYRLDRPRSHPLLAVTGRLVEGRFDGRGQRRAAV